MRNILSVFLILFPLYAGAATSELQTHGVTGQNNAKNLQAMVDLIRSEIAKAGK